MTKLKISGQESENSGVAERFGPPIFEERLSDEAEAMVEKLKSSYPDCKSAIMPALYIAQESFGSITKDAVSWVANRIGVSPVLVMEVASFFTMYYKKPVGKYHVQVCRTLCCALRGSKWVSEKLQSRFGVAPGDVTADGFWSYEEVECLGSCGTAPMAQINDVNFENLTPEGLDQILDRIEKEQPDLRFSTIKDQLGAGMSDHSRSQLKWTCL
jgi:NADH-quinone oxidoreductase E subunit